MVKNSFSGGKYISVIYWGQASGEECSLQHEESVNTNNI